MADWQRRSRSACSGIRKQGQSNFRGEALRKKTLTLVAGDVVCGGCEKPLMLFAAINKYSRYCLPPAKAGRAVFGDMARCKSQFPGSEFFFAGVSRKLL
ncbi:hypothetical protein [Actimicrobium antarcticum]|uniref:hypothetical protein n=1 Tax=Actimicrobium antarcticum TaxID=1051899 RepID=UPI0031D3758E